MGKNQIRIISNALTLHQIMQDIDPGHENDYFYVSLKSYISNIQTNTG